MKKQSGARSENSTNAAYAMSFAQGERRFGMVNWLGLATLCRREVMRFLKVYLQTLLAPVATALLFLAVFTLALGQAKGDVAGVSFAQFLAPGVVMMTVIQNAFANTSSSLMIAKVQGNIFDSLTPPLSPTELMVGMAFGGAARGVMVAVFSLLCILPLPIVASGVAHPIWALFFALGGSIMLSLLGVIAAVWAVKFDHLAVVTNFVILPLSFLSGTFYATNTLPEPWRTLSDFNPFHYLIDGFRFAIVDHDDPADPWLGAAVVLVSILALGLLCRRIFATGYRLKT